MTTRARAEEVAREWLRDTWPWSLDEDGPSEREAKKLSLLLDAFASEREREAGEGGPADRGDSSDRRNRH
jgi:hypothetical protein